MPAPRTSWTVESPARQGGFTPGEQSGLARFWSGVAILSLLVEK